MIFAVGPRAEYGSLFPNPLRLLDGNFLRFCRPHGVGIKLSLLDQGQFYTGEKCAHGIKHLAAFFPNGMAELVGLFLGTVTAEWRENPDG